MKNEILTIEDAPESIGFSMSPFGYTVTLERGPDGGYGCRGRDGCHAKYFWNVSETFEQFKTKLREHVDATH